MCRVRLSNVPHHSCSLDLWLKSALDNDLFLDVCGQTHVTPRGIALCPFHIQHTYHCSCFLTVRKLALTSWNIVGTLLSPAHTWMPLWYVSIRHYAAHVCAAWGPASPEQAAPSVKTTQLKRWRCHSSTTRAIPQLNVLACVEVYPTSPKGCHYYHEYLRYPADPWQQV